MKRYIRSSYEKQISAVTWPDGSAVSDYTLLKAVIWFYNESIESAKRHIQSLSTRELQTAVDYYSRHIHDL